MTQLTPEWRARFQDFLARCISMSVATTSPSGSPRVADVYFVSDAELNLYFYSDPASRHSRNIQRDPRVAVTTRTDSMDWHEIQGLQVEGIASVIDAPDEHSLAWELMCDKFPFYRSFTDAVASLKMYRITPRRIRWTDNSISFGYKEDFELDER
jgi:uncharacterized protein YhbP (UPF0306 family)